MRVTLNAFLAGVTAFMLLTGTIAAQEASSTTTADQSTSTDSTATDSTSTDAAGQASASGGTQDSASDAGTTPQDNASARSRTQTSQGRTGQSSASTRSRVNTPDSDTGASGTGGVSDQDDSTPRRPTNSQIPGRATGRPDNNQLPGQAFDSDAQQDASEDPSSRIGGGATDARSRTRSQLDRRGQSNTSTRARLNTQDDQTDDATDSDANDQAGDSTPRRPANRDIPGRATGRPDNDELPGQPFSGAQDDASDASDASDAQDAFGSQRSRTPSQRNRSGQSSTSTRNRLNAQDSDDADSDATDSGAGNEDSQFGETPRRPSNRDIPGRATGRRDNDELPGAAFNRDQQDDDQQDDASDEMGEDSSDDQSDDQSYRRNRQRSGDSDDASDDQQTSDDVRSRRSRSDRPDSQRNRDQDRTRRQARDRDSDTDVDVNADADADVNADVDADANADVDADVSANLGAQFSADDQDRLRITRIEQNSVLADAGLRRGDVLVSVLDQRISSLADFRDVIISADADRIPVTVLRGGRQQRIFIDADAVSSIRQFRSNARAITPLGVRFDNSIRDRVVIRSIAPSSFLVRSGLRPGDIVTMVAGRPVRSYRDFSTIVMRANPGERIPVIVMRDDREETLYITAQTTRYEESSVAGGAWLGVYFDERYDNAAVVRSVQPGSPAEEAGVRPGDRIVTLNDQQVRSHDDVSQIIGEMDPGSQVSIEVARQVTRQLEATLEQRQGEVAEYGDQDEDYSVERYRERDDVDYDVDVNDDFEVNTRRGEIRMDDERGAFDTGDRDGRILNRDDRPGMRGRARVRP